LTSDESGIAGLVIQPSAFGPKETMDRLVAAVGRRGAAVLARIDHAAAAARVGLELRPTEVVIFGNATAGTPLMQQAQTIAIDLPLKALVWQDEQGRTLLAYNDLRWLAGRHGEPVAMERTLAAMTEMLAAVAREATTKATF
jgi:uncharacterized protein (DUF302 family)